MVYVFPVVMRNVTYKCAGGIVTHYAGTKGVTVLIEGASYEAKYPVDLSFCFVICPV